MKKIYLVCVNYSTPECPDCYEITFGPNIPQYISASNKYVSQEYTIVYDSLESCIEFLKELGFDFDKIPSDFFDGKSFIELEISCPGLNQTNSTSNKIESLISFI